MNRCVVILNNILMCLFFRLYAIGITHCLKRAIYPIAYRSYEKALTGPQALLSFCDSVSSICPGQLRWKIDYIIFTTITYFSDPLVFSKWIFQIDCGYIVTLSCFLAFTHIFSVNVPEVIIVTSLAPHVNI